MSKVARKVTVPRLLLAGFLLFAIHSISTPQVAFATNPAIINFQGKVVNANGTNVADGTYSFDFILYDDITLGTPSDGVRDKWHELSKSVTVTSGVFQTYLGSATALPDFNANSALYLAVRFNADSAGYMSPRVQLASVPYAINSDKLGGMTAASFGQLSASQTWTGTNTLQPTTNITSAIVKQTSFATPTADIFSVQTVNGTSILQITGPAINEAAVTLNSVGATRALTLDSGSGSIVLGSNTTTLQKSGAAFTFDLNNASNSTFTITNAAAGVARLAVEGGISSTGSGTITTAGTIGTATTTTFTGADATFSGTINLGTVGTGTALSTLHLADTSNATGTQIVTIGSTGNAANITTIQGGGSASTVVIQTAASGGIDIGVNAVAGKTVNIGSVGITAATTTLRLADSTAAVQTVSIGSTNTTSATTIQGGSNNITLNTSTGNKIIIGSATDDTNQVLLQFDSFSTFADTATCSTTVNQGSMYYNTATNALRACVNGVWEDMVSTAGLGLQLFGVVPDTGAAGTQGDLAAVTGTGIGGPCKVSVGSTTAIVAWTACTVYSGGRKVLVTAGTFATSTGTANDFSHLCLNGTNNQPFLNPRGAETANLASVSLPNVASPILCLADIKFAGAATAITQIYDTRTYTTTLKETVSIGTTAPTIGMLTQSIATKGTVIPMATAGGSNIYGVVVAATGSPSTNTINGIVAVGGPAAVKAITGTNVVNAYVVGSTTAGYATSSASHTNPATGTGLYSLGLARNVWSGATACTANTDSCAGSILVSISKL